jgi:simple sugar transport system ATP-binding protein
VGARNAGAAVLLVSEDLDELLDLADRIVVMREGRIVHEADNGRTPDHTPSGASAQEIGAHMVGGG